jgi:uncharacterized protein YcsI (UPF0317 family)
MRMAMDRSALAQASSAEVRAAIRDGLWTTHTSGLAAGYTQANLVILPQEYAYDFLLFCVRNPKPCPLLDVTDVGSAVPTLAAAGADLRTDLPRYRVYKHGEMVEEPTSLVQLWRDDLVAFLLGCSYTFEHALVAAGIRMRHFERGTNVPMFRTSRDCVQAGRFHGPMVVSMRPIPAGQVARTVEISARYPQAHGAPIHVGEPAALGIRDIGSPDWGDPLLPEAGDVPVFWACGVTPQAVAMQVRPPLMITHSPGHMFITDIPLGDLATNV